MDAGKKAAPCSQLDDFIVSIIQSGSDGSSMAMPMLANVIAPAATNMYGSLISVISDAPSCSSRTIFGCRTSSCKPNDNEYKSGKELVINYRLYLLADKVVQWLSRAFR